MAFPDLTGLDSAEDFFEALGVPYDRRVLDVYRLHVLRRFGLEREAIDQEGALGDEERLGRYRAALGRAHATFALPSAPEERLFRVFEGPPLVALSARK